MHPHGVNNLPTNAADHIPQNEFNSMPMTAMPSVQAHQFEQKVNMSPPPTCMPTIEGRQFKVMQAANSFCTWQELARVSACAQIPLHAANYTSESELHVFPEDTDSKTSVNSNCIATTPTNWPVHEPENQSELSADFDSSEPLDIEEVFCGIHTRGMNLFMHPNEAVLNGLSTSGERDSVPHNLVFGAKPPGSSSLLASATCNH